MYTVQSNSVLYTCTCAMISVHVHCEYPTRKDFSIFIQASHHQNFSSSGHSNLMTFGSTVDESYDGMDIRQEHQKQQRFSGLSPVISSANLTPERFQQPVMMLNSLQQQGHMKMSPAANAVSGGGHMMASGSTSAGSSMMSSWMSDHVTSVANDVAGGMGVGGGAGMVGVVNQQMMSPYGAKLERFGKPGDEKRRRSSSTSGPPLDDQGECGRGNTFCIGVGNFYGVMYMYMYMSCTPEQVNHI